MGLSEPSVSTRRLSDRMPAPPPAALPWLGLLALLAVILAAQPAMLWLVRWPDEWALPLAEWINAISGALVARLRPAFRMLSALLEEPL